MANCSDSVSQQAAEVNLQNLKASADRFINLMQQGAEDNQKDARAWDSLKLRVATNAATIDHLAQIGLIQAGQTGFTENQQNTSPAAQAAGEAIKGGVGVSAEQVAANVAALADVAVKFSEIVSALNAMVLAQTQPRSPAAASGTPAA